MDCTACGHALPDAVFPGGRVRCACGAVMTSGGHDGASRPPGGGVYRTAAERGPLAGTMPCPFCGGACADEALVCPHCDVHLTSARCPHCFCLYFVGSRCCGRCGQELQPEPLLDATDAPCPRCGEPLRVAPGAGADDALEGLAVVHECVGCRGVFLDNGSLQRVLARCSRPPVADGRAVHAAPPAPGTAPEPVRYLRCPLCQELMNRVNFGRRSGIVVDVCTPHGTWFDAGELTRAVDFLARGGLEASKRIESEGKRELARMAARLEAELSSTGRGGLPEATTWVDRGFTLLDILSELFR